MRHTSRTASGLLAAAVLASTLLVGAAPASAAVGGNCAATTQVKEVTGPNYYRGRGYCRSLTSSSHARVRLIRDGGTDYSSSWFTTLNKYYYTGYYLCYAGCHGRTDVDHI